jgi:hypothetical protein
MLSILLSLLTLSMAQINWFDRKFEFGNNENTMPSVIERLEGTPVRLKEKFRMIEPSILRIKPEGKWSILEQAGHLSDIEPLWQGRLADILNGRPELRIADLTNRATTEANHNSRTPEELVEKFQLLRTITVDRLRALKEADIFKYALHPRLKTPMRTIDLFIFVAEHDDHHLAKITEIAKARI